MTTPSRSQLSRRQLLGAAGAAMVGGAAMRQALADEDSSSAAGGRLKQSIVHWCFAEHWSVEETVKVARQLGCQSVELVPPKYFPLLKENGLQCAIGIIDLAPDPPFAKGWNNPKYRQRVDAATRAAIDACAEFGFKKVIAFTGMREDLSDEQGAAHCVEGFKQIMPYAEKKDVTLCLEQLNTRDDTHPMKGHPGYQGDHTDYCVDIIQRVGSSHLKLLFDVYHVQIMDGDVIRRLRQHKDVIGHVHTAGNPGRCELDEDQEIAYPAVMKALADTGYQGYVGHEFIPTTDPLKGLQQAVKLCKV